MNRNTEIHFGNIPKIHQQRSKLDESSSVTTSMNCADIVPLKVWEILPGDTVEMDMSAIVRLSTPIVPTMDNLITDYYFFFVPRRLTWEHWEQFWGQNDDEWTQTTPYEVPQIESPSGGWTKGTIADYMSIPTGIDDLSIDACYFRGYAKIINDWFRDENLKKACHIYTDDTTRTGSNGTNYINDPELGGKCSKSAKTADMFTKCQPTPQRGPSVSVPIGTKAPVYPTNDYLTSNKLLEHGPGLRWYELYVHSGETDPRWDLPQSSELPAVKPNGAFATTGNASGSTYNALSPSNLWADLGEATAATINELRTAFAIQKYYESVALYGTRYIEYLRGIFGVESSDGRLQRSEYIGGTRVPVNMSAIVQTSSTDATSPQGHASGYSCTNHRESIFTKSFEEHGILYCLCTTRIDKHTYQQGVDKMFKRKRWSDFYVPHFSHLGAMPVYNYQIYCQGDSVVDSDGNIIDNQVFGYQEAWSEYRYQQNVATGEMRSTYATSLDVYHYGDDYAALPTLGSSWIDEDSSSVDRTLAIPSNLTDQLKANIYFKCFFTRVMPVYSMPGLIDHV